MATLDQIALEAGVSAGVVSRVLRNRLGGTRVSKKTRRRVLEVAERLNYVPAAHARILQQDQSPFIGVLIHVGTHLRAGIIDAVSQQAWQRQREVLLGIHRWDKQAALEQVRIFASYRTAGVVVASGSRMLDEEVADALHRLRDQCGPTVCFGLLRTPEDLASVTLDAEAICQAFARGLFDAGIGIAVGISMTETFGPLFKRALSAFPALEARVVHMDQHAPTRDDAEPVARQLKQWRQAGRVGVIVNHDLHAAAVLMACQRLGLRVPEDVAFMGWGNQPPVCQLCTPTLTSHDLFGHLPEMAGQALNMIEQTPRGESPPLEHRKVLPPLIQRESFV